MEQAQLVLVTGATGYIGGRLCLGSWRPAIGCAAWRAMPAASRAVPGANRSKWSRGTPPGLKPCLLRWQAYGPSTTSSIA